MPSLNGLMNYISYFMDLIESFIRKIAFYMDIEYPVPTTPAEEE